MVERLVLQAYYPHAVTISVPVNILPPELDVVCLGSSLVDVLAQTDDETLSRLGLIKGTMDLIDLQRADEIYAEMGQAVEVSGGAAANTAAGVAALGGKSGFIGKVADDAFGEIFTHDMRALGVRYQPTPVPAAAGKLEAQGTGRCLVLVTPDHERTLNTHLGAATTLAPADIDGPMVASASVLYIEGYLFDAPQGPEAVREAIRIAHEAGASVALSLADPLCVERHRREFLDLLVDELDLVLCNEEEALGLFNTPSLDDAIEAFDETGLLVAVTLGAKGSVVISPGEISRVDAVSPEQVVDTTGAGDLFAAGFLYALTHGRSPELAAQLGGLCASEVISHMGPRPQVDLAQLAREAGLIS